MFCQFCGASMLPNARFCPECGASVTGEPAGSQSLEANGVSKAASYQQSAGQRETAPLPAGGQQLPLEGAGQQPNGQQRMSGQQSFEQQPYGQQGGSGQQLYDASMESAEQKRSVSPVLIIVIAIAVVALVLILAAGLGVFSPNKGGGGSTPVPGVTKSTAQSASQSGPANGQPASGGATSSSTPSGGTSSAAAPAPNSTSAASSSAAAPSSSAVSSASAVDARKQAIDKAFADGYEVFEGTLRVLTAEELAVLQNVDPKLIGGIDGTYAVLVFDAEIQVSGMGSDGSGMRRQGAKMLGVAQQTKYASSGDLDSWRSYDGQHIAVAAMAEDIWFPSDVRLPVGEPATANAIVLG